MTLSEQIAEIRERVGRMRIGLKDALSIIDMTFEDQIKRLDASSPYEAFTGLNKLIDLTVHGAKIERSLLIFRDRGNIYALRKRVEGIHLQEAFDQLRTSPYLREMNHAVGIDRAMFRTINDIRKWLEMRFKSRFKQEIEDLTYFFPWDIETNIPRIHVDTAGVSLDMIWIA